MNDYATKVVGMDIGDRFTQVCELDEGGELVEEGRIRTTAQGLRRWARRRGRMLVALEVGTHSPWVSRLLGELGQEVVVANPRKVRLIYGSACKTDRLDAEALARLARMDRKLLYPIRHRNEGSQQALSVIRSRALLVRSRTQLINGVRGLVKSVGARMPRCSTAHFSKRTDEIPNGLREAVEPLMEQIAQTTQAIAQLDETIERLARERYPETAVLRTAPGVGPLTSLAYVLTLEDPTRFSRSREVGAYLGLTRGRRQTGARDPECRITKAGDPYLRQLLVGSAQYILGPFGADCDLRRWGQRLARRGGSHAKKRAVVAVARKLSVVLHRMWITGMTFEAFAESPEAEVVS